MEHQYRQWGENLLLRPLAHGDIESLRNWRNDPRLTVYLTSIGYITPEKQEQWYERYLLNSDEYIFSIVCQEEQKDTLIGSISLYDFHQDECECGKFMIGSMAYKGRGLGRKSLALCLKIAFGQLGMSKCVAHVDPNNTPSFASFINLGFRIDGKEPNGPKSYEYKLSIIRDRYEKLNGEV